MRIASNAYPGMGIVTAEDRENARQRMAEVHDDPARRIFGHYRDGKVLGVMILYDFQMNLLAEMVPAGGVGQVAVDLLHKKEHVAKEMMSYSIGYFRQRDVPMIVLYPFRHDFYMNMGFGHGPKVHHYRLNPAALPRGESKEHVRFLDAADREAVSARVVGGDGPATVLRDRQLVGTLAGGQGGDDRTAGHVDEGGRRRTLVEHHQGAGGAVSGLGRHGGGAKDQCHRNQCSRPASHT